MYRQSNIKQVGVNKDTKESAQVRKEQIGKQKKNEAKLMKEKDE
jgi:hypothetical protein